MSRSVFRMRNLAISAGLLALLSIPLLQAQTGSAPLATRVAGLAPEAAAAAPAGAQVIPASLSQPLPEPAPAPEASAEEDDGTLDEDLAAASDAAAPPALPAAQVTPEADPVEDQSDLATGPVTGLPLPRYVSMKASEANIRRGPSLTHRIDWVYHRRDMPLQVTAEHGHWRRVQDSEGMGGWVHYSLISGNRTVLVTGDRTTLTYRPDTSSPAVAMLEAGVVAELHECTRDWCKLEVSGYKGWAPKTVLWGVAPDELRE